MIDFILYMNYYYKSSQIEKYNTQIKSSKKRCKLLGIESPMSAVYYLQMNKQIDYID